MELLSYLLGKKSSGGGSSGLDWSAIGYSEEPSIIEDGYNHALSIKNNWDSTVSSLKEKFINDTNLVFMPVVDTSNATTMQSCFEGCTSLLIVPLLDTSHVTTFRSMFSNCDGLSSIPLFDTSSLSANTSFNQFVGSVRSLTDESLDNILQMCINAKSYPGTKTLAYLGVSSTYYSATRIQALPHYEDFIDAGWTIGY